MDPLEPASTTPEARTLEPTTVLLLVGLAVVAWLWRAPFVGALVWFGTLAHESGHAVAAEALGGDVVTLTINHQGGGVTAWRSVGELATWRRVVIASAGYVGAVAFGVGLLVLAARGRHLRVAIGAVAVGMALLLLLWVPWNGPSVDGAAALASGSSSSDGRFTWLFCLGAIVATVGLLWAPRPVQQGVLVFVGVTSVLAGLDALRVLVGLDDGVHSDARAVAELLSVPTALVVAVWFAVAAGLCWWAMRTVLRPPPAASGPSDS